MKLDIDDELHELIEERAARVGFENADAYAEFVLETVLAELEDGTDDEDAAVKDRLEDLGYMS